MEKNSLSFKVTEEDRGKRLDRFLADNLSERFSRAFLQKLISASDVTVNGAAVKSHYKVKTGDSLEVVIPPPKPWSIKPEDIKLDIVYEDESLLVVNKPCEMVVHPAPGNYRGTLVNALLAHCGRLSSVGGVAKPGIVHRLDKGTSGLLVVAKTDEAHRVLSGQFKNKTTRRVYVALVKGVVELDNGIIELPIGRSAYDRTKMAVKYDGAKEAKTQYKVLKRFKRHTLLELTLGTGRTHQIRVHMAHLGHPLVGDEKYGNRGHQLPHPALHAKTLGFLHPVTKKYMEFTSELPADMNEVISAGDL